MKNKGCQAKNVFILGMASDIGIELAKRYLEDGFNVLGTYRDKKQVAVLEEKGAQAFKCDIMVKNDVKKCLSNYAKSGQPWDIFISCVGSMEPIDNFFKCDFDRWEQSIILNSTAQLRFLHGIHPLRKKNASSVVFFAGGGTNNPFKNYSAYCASKIMLIKICELLDDENKDLNVFIVGPGWVRTKIHNQTISSAGLAGKSYKKTLEFLKSDNPGTDYKDIYDCINWCIKQGAKVAGGRNFSVVYDRWKKGGDRLARQLRLDPDKFKLRRFRNIN